MRQNQPRRTVEHTPRQQPDPVSYWLIAEKQNYRLGVLTIRTDDEQETLPVSRSEQEAQIFLRFGGVTGGRRARRSSARELVSLLSGPCAGGKKVAQLVPAFLSSLMANNFATKWGAAAGNPRRHGRRDVPAGTFTLGEG
jgi:hypothetical protein